MDILVPPVMGPIHLYISQHLRNPKASCATREIASRVSFLALVPFSLIPSAADAIIGTGIGVVAVLSGGTLCTTNDIHRRYIDSTNHLLSQPYICLLRTINPNVLVESPGRGYFTSKVQGFIAQAIRNCNESESTLVKHFVSRLTFALYGIASVVTRAVDGVLGVIAALFSFMTLGYFTELNRFAYRNLQVTGVIEDLVKSILGCMRPSLAFPPTPPVRDLRSHFLDGVGSGVQVSED